MTEEEQNQSSGKSTRTNTFLKKKKKKVHVNVQYLNQSSQFNKKKTSPFVTTPKEFDKIWNKVLGKLQHLLLATAWG